MYAKYLNINTKKKKKNKERTEKIRNNNFSYLLTKKFTFLYISICTYYIIIITIFTNSLDFYQLYINGVYFKLYTEQILKF